jgi:hypothetical protein
MRSILRSALAAFVAALALGVAGASSASASTFLCVPEASGATVTSGGTEGKCNAGNTSVKLPGAADLATLGSILPHIKFVESGIGGKPTVEFEGVNVQIVKGGEVVNGAGNLVIGSDKNAGKHEQAGSENLIVGDNHTYGTGAFGDIIGGYANTALTSGDVVFGASNTVTGGAVESVLGGEENTVSAATSTVAGGRKNSASLRWSSILGGQGNTASGFSSAVGGGYKNTASGELSGVFGGKELTAKNLYESLL